MATFYFNGAVDGDWATLGNWWMDSDHTVAATALPTSSDSVISSANIFLNSGSEPTVTNLTVSGSWVRVQIALTVTGMATFNVQSYNAGTLNGNCTFNGSSFNKGTVNGDCTFNGSSYSDVFGSVFGVARFNQFTAVGGAVTDTLGQGTGYVTGGIQDSQGNPVTLWRMILGLNVGRIVCDAEFIGTGGCYFGTCDGAVTFSDQSQCEGLNCSAVPVFRGQSTCRYTPADWLSPARINVFNNDQGAYFEESSMVGRFAEYSGAMPRNRTTYPIQRGINGSSILGVI